MLSSSYIEKAKKRIVMHQEFEHWNYWVRAYRYLVMSLKPKKREQVMKSSETSKSVFKHYSINRGLTQLSMNIIQLNRI